MSRTAIKTTSFPTTRKTSTRNDLWSRRFSLIAQSLDRDFSASVNRVAEADARPDPFKVLVSTIISLRTRDEVTFAASKRLFQHAATAQTILELGEDRIAELIYPAGFYRTKAGNICKICEILEDRYDGAVPNTRDELVALPGVGRKTANLVLGLGFGIEAICVDIHVHRIPNRLGWIATNSPDESEEALMAIVPQRYWIPMNELLVGFGQQLCTPRSPRCSECPFTKSCPRNGVGRTR